MWAPHQADTSEHFSKSQYDFLIKCVSNKEMYLWNNFWNKQREDNKKAEILLEYADLRKVDLNGVDLREANLRGANLIEACLVSADLRGANLRGANFREANLSEADLRGANLVAANLRGANLREADLLDAGLRGANLIDANLRGAILIGTVLTKADLVGADLRSAILTKADIDKNTPHGADLRETVCRDTDTIAPRLPGSKNVEISNDDKQNTAYLEITIAENIQITDLTKLLSSLNRIHRNLSTDGKPLSIESIKIRTPDLEYSSSEDLV